MDFEEINDFCLSLKGVYLDFPFNETTAVYKLAGKMIIMLDINEVNPSIVIKSDPIISNELFEKYEFVFTGYHMNKKHWITVNTEDISYNSIYKKLIKASYDLVYAKLSKKLKAEVDEIM